MTGNPGAFRTATIPQMPTTIQLQAHTSQDRIGAVQAIQRALSARCRIRRILVRLSQSGIGSQERGPDVRNADLSVS